MPFIIFHHKNVNVCVFSERSDFGATGVFFFNFILSFMPIVFRRWSATTAKLESFKLETECEVVRCKIKTKMSE